MQADRSDRGNKNRWCPSAKDRTDIEDMAAQGVTREVIASKFSVSLPTLAKHCPVELARGKARNKNALFGILMKHALTTTNPSASITSAKYLLATRHRVYEGDTSRVTDLEAKVAALEERLAERDTTSNDHGFPDSFIVPQAAATAEFDVHAALAEIVGRSH
jgi:hypothetical protein